MINPQLKNILRYYFNDDIYKRKGVKREELRVHLKRLYTEEKAAGTPRRVAVVDGGDDEATQAYEECDDDTAEEGSGEGGEAQNTSGEAQDDIDDGEEAQNGGSSQAEDPDEKYLV